VPDNKRAVMIDYARQGGWSGYQWIWSVYDDPLNANVCASGESKSNCFLRAGQAGARDGANYLEAYEPDIVSYPEATQAIADLLD